MALSQTVVHTGWKVQSLSCFLETATKQAYSFSCGHLDSIFATEQTRETAVITGLLEGMAHVYSGSSPPWQPRTKPTNELNSGRPYLAHKKALASGKFNSIKTLDKLPLDSVPHGDGGIFSSHGQ